MKNRKRNRMKGFDYSSDNIYFVTICVQDRLCCLGSVILIESAVGTGRDLSVRHPNENHPNENHPNENHPNENHPNENHPNENHPNENHSNENHPNENHPNENHPNENHSNENHPNEFIKKMELNQFGKIVYERMLWLMEQYQYVDIHNFVVMPNHVHAIIEIARTGRDLSGQVQEHEAIKIKSLSSLVGAFKTTSSKIIHQSGFLNFAWQRSFHDHIIRNEKSYLNISHYIDTNPDKWTVDTFFEKN